MKSLTIYDKTGAEVGTMDVDVDAIAPKVSKQLMHDAVVMYQGHARQGTHRTRNRSEVAGSTRKLYRQKGTGNARAGQRSANVRRGGGMAFARRPRSYGGRMPRKAVQAATRMAIASKLNGDQVVVIDDLAFAEPRTRDLAATLKALKLDGRSTLVATAEHAPNIYKSARNIPKVEVSPVSDLNALTVLKPNRLLVTKAAMEAIAEKATG
jgi:large subunit ribosomal protein L4